MIKFILKKILNHDSRIYKRLQFISTLTPAKLFVNFIFQRIFRLNSDADISIHFTSTMNCFNNIKLYKDKTTLRSFAVSGNCYFQAINGIHIGHNFLFAPGVKIISTNHESGDLSKPKSDTPVIIGNNVWVGANAIILPGVIIGNNCIIGAGSVVTKSFKKNNLIIAGNPAIIINQK